MGNEYVMIRNTFVLGTWVDVGIKPINVDLFLPIPDNFDYEVMHLYTYEIDTGKLFNEKGELIYAVLGTEE